MSTVHYYSIIVFSSPDNSTGKLLQRVRTIICLVHNISFKTEKKKRHCVELNLAFTLPNLAMLTANDKQSIVLSILREVNLAKNTSNKTGKSIPDIVAAGNRFKLV